VTSAQGTTLKALMALTSTQAAVVMASLAVPTLAPVLAPIYGVEAARAGYFSALLFATAFLASAWSGPMVRRYGSIRVSQGTVILALAALFLIAGGSWPGLILAALALGVAYAPGNPASSALLVRVTPIRQRGFIFSLKQTAVPIGGAMAGIGLTALAAVFDWRLALMLAAGLCLVLLLVVQPWRGGLDLDRNPAAGLRASPFVLFRALETRALKLTALLAFSFAAVQFAFSAIFVAYLTQRFDMAVTQAGQALSLALVASIILRIVLGSVADRLGGFRVLAGMAVLMLGAAVLCAMAPQEARTLAVAGGIVLGSIAFGWNGVFLSEAARIAPEGKVAEATSACMACVFLGGAIGPAAFSGLVSISGGFVLPFAVLGGFAAMGLAASLLAGRHSPPRGARG